MPERFVCVCDCIPCKTLGCEYCNLFEASEGEMGSGDLCEEKVEEYDYGDEPYPLKIPLFRCEKDCKVERCSRRSASPEREKFWDCEDRRVCGIRFDESFNNMDNSGKTCETCIFGLICPGLGPGLIINPDTNKPCIGFDSWTDIKELGTWKDTALSAKKNS